MKLYEYQNNVISCCQKSNSHSQLISMPTGTGKTVTFLTLAKMLGKKTLILVHRDELLKQTYDKALKIGFKEEDISIINAEKKDNISKLNIAMVQSLKRNLEKYERSDIEAIIVDEAHHSTAQSYIDVFNHFQIFEKEKHLFGFTATPLRGDKEHLGSIFKEHTFKMTLSEATQLGYIVPVHGLRISMEKSLNEIKTKQGDYDIEELDRVMNCDSVNKLIVERCENLKKTPAIIFTTSVNHAEELAKRLREKKRKAISVSYKTSKRILAIIFRMLEQGRIDFITNAVKLSEGFDFPAIRSVILARPTRSPVLYKQMIGRGLRNYPDKFDCFVLEFTSNDPKMMKWEDIDENATFQSSSQEKYKTREDAINKYKSIFSSPNVHVLDVRVSPFEFYECKIRRLIKYKRFYFSPFTEGFTFYEIKNSGHQDGNYLHCYGSMFFWKEKYKSFYAWGEYNYQMTPADMPQKMESIIVSMHLWSKKNRLGKWYPSEYEPVTRHQILLMKELSLPWKSIKSSRKAEMEIEEKVIKKAIDQFMSKGFFSGIMEIK